MFQDFLFHSITGWGLCIEFLIAACFVIYFGNKLSLLADVIGEKTNLGSAWMGLILVSFITSLPELVTSIGAILIFNQPDLAMGNILGSNCFNVVIFALLILLAKSMVNDGYATQRISIHATLVLTILCIIGIYFSKSIAVIGVIISIMILIGYLFTFFKITSHPQEIAEISDTKFHQYELKNTLVWFIIFSLIIVACGLWLVQLADQIAVYPFHIGSYQLILGQSFVGTILVAGSTSLPEIVISLSALGRSSIGLALGNVIGSNLFNLVILSVTDFLYFGNLYKNSSNIHLITGILSFILIYITLLTVKFFTTYRRLLAWFIIIIYVLGVFVLFKVGVQV